MLLTLRRPKRPAEQGQKDFACFVVLRRLQIGAYCNCRIFLELPRVRFSLEKGWLDAPPVNP